MACVSSQLIMIPHLAITTGTYIDVLLEAQLRVLSKSTFEISQTLATIKRAERTKAEWCPSHHPREYPCS